MENILFDLCAGFVLRADDMCIFISFSQDAADAVQVALG